MKNIFRIESLAFTINNQPVELKGVVFETEASAQELSVSGGNINSLVEIIGNIAERFDNNKPEIKEINVEPKAEAVEVKPEPITDFCEIKVKEKTKKPELPTSSWSGGEHKPKFNITKAWKAIPVPKEMNRTDKDQYRWEGEKGLLGDSVSVNGATYGAVYVHIYSMKQRCFISIRADNVKFEDDIRPEEFNEFLDTIDIPESVKEYIRKVVEL